MRALVTCLLLSATLLTGCGQSSSSTPIAAAEAAPPPPPPEPFRDCTAEEIQTIGQAMNAYAVGHTECVINKGSMTAHVDKCKRNNGTGYLHATSRVTFDDSFTEKPYEVAVSGTTDPVGASPVLEIFTTDDENYNNACVGLGIMAVTACAASQSCRNGGSDN